MNRPAKLNNHLTMHLSKLSITIIYCSIIMAGSTLFFSNAQAAQDSKIIGENATQEDYQSVKNGNYSATHRIKNITRLSDFRNLQQGTCTVQILLKDENDRSLSHGFKDKVQSEKLAKGIPLDQHPIAFVKYQPVKSSEKTEITRYELKERC